MFHQLSSEGTASLRCPAKTRLSVVVFTAWAILHKPACHRPQLYPACNSLRHLRGQSYNKARTLWTVSVQQTQTTVFKIKEAQKEAFLHMDVSPVVRTSCVKSQQTSAIIHKHCITHPCHKYLSECSICKGLHVLSLVFVRQGTCVLACVCTYCTAHTWTWCLCTTAFNLRCNNVKRFWKSIH